MRLELSRPLADFEVIFKAYRSLGYPMSNMLKGGGAYFDSKNPPLGFCERQVASHAGIMDLLSFLPLRSVPHVYNSDYHIRSLP